MSNSSLNLNLESIHHTFQPTPLWHLYTCTCAPTRLPARLTARPPA